MLLFDSVWKREEKEKRAETETQRNKIIGRQGSAAESENAS